MGSRVDESLGGSVGQRLARVLSGLGQTNFDLDLPYCVGY